MDRVIVFDVETPNRRNDRISAIGLSVIENGRIVNEYATLVNPETWFDAFNVQLTGISPADVRTAPDFPALWRQIGPLMESGVLAAHNAVFDLGVLKKCLLYYGLPAKRTARYLCTVQMGRQLLPGVSHKLNDLCGYYGIDLLHHRAGSDAHACAEILLRYLESGADPAQYLRTYTLLP